MKVFFALSSGEVTAGRCLQSCSLLSARAREVHANRYWRLVARILRLWIIAYIYYKGSVLFPPHCLLVSHWLKKIIQPGRILRRQTHTRTKNLGQKLYGIHTPDLTTWRFQSAYHYKSQVGWADEAANVCTMGPSPWSRGRHPCRREMGCQCLWWSGNPAVLRFMFYY